MQKWMFTEAEVDIISEYFILKEQNRQEKLEKKNQKVNYDEDVKRYVNFYIPNKFIDMIDKLSYKYAEGNRTQMLIKLIVRGWQDEKKS